jgi:hypothetical protein
MDMPCLFFRGLENVHKDPLPRDDSQLGLMIVKPWGNAGSLQECAITVTGKHIPFIQTWDVLITSWKTTYSGGALFIITDEGWIYTSSEIPTAR